MKSDQPQWRNCRQYLSNRIALNANRLAPLGVRGFYDRCTISFFRTRQPLFFLSTFILWLSLISPLQAAETWQDALARMPLRTNVTELTRTELSASYQNLRDVPAAT